MTFLDVKNLQVSFDTYKGKVHAVNNVSFRVAKSEILGIVGESGCGKTVTSLSLMRLISEPPGKVTGSVMYKGEDLLHKSEEEMRSLRGKEISMIFQNPGTALNPVFTIGDQIISVIRLHRKMNKKDAWEEAVKIFELVGMPHPANIMKTYPHQLSGGMKQRIMIGITLSCQASLVIADEPTTALDVTIQAQILKLLVEMRDKLGVSIILITHDVGVAAQTCDRIMVMYGGGVVEEGTTTQVLTTPNHPYTKGLLGCLPFKAQDIENLATIKGSVPDMTEIGQGCTFYPRCAYRMERCKTEKPGLYTISEKQTAACFLMDRGEEVE